MATQEKVLVTGGSGFLAGWIISTLLQRGFAVRTTVRQLDRAAAVRAKVGNSDQLEFVAADLHSDAGWSEATAGIHHLIHTATPMTARGPELLSASRDGTIRVLRAAAANSVQRVVITSSGYAALPPPGPRGAVQLTNERVWTNLEAKRLSDYARAKTLSERDAWDFAAAHPQIQLTTVLPGLIIGPLQSQDISPSMSLINSMLKGQLLALPDVGMNIVDVRDLADLHVMALTSPAAVEERFLAFSDFIWFRDMAAILRGKLGPDGTRVSTRRMPDLLLRALALVSPAMGDFVPRLGRELRAETRKARDLLGWQPRPVEETLIDSARSLIALRRAEQHR